MVSDAAKGLFHKAIAQSAQQSPLRGMTEKRFGLTPEVDIGAKYMSSLGAKSLAELRKLPVQKLVLDGSAYYAGEFGGPFVDGQIIKGDPIPLFAAGKQAKVPFMIGTNSFDSDFMLPGEPSLEVFTKKIHEDPKIIEKLYADVKDKCILNSFVIQDLMYRASTKLLASSMNGVAPGYAYYYDYLTQNIRASLPGAPHTYEIPYVFGSLALVPQAPKQALTGVNQCARIEKDVAEFKKTHAWPKDWFPIVDKNSPQDQAMSERLSSSWAAFARTGNPNVSGQANWPIYNLNADVMRNFSPSSEAITGLLKDRVAYQALHLREIYAIERLKDAF
jgi:para-nitrobenzyl esterase